MHLHLLDKTPAVVVYHDTTNDWLFLDWHGALTLPLVQEGCQAVLTSFLQRPCLRILNNNLDVTALSPEVPAWLAAHFLPFLDQTGLGCLLAWVLPPHLLVAQSASEHVADSTVTTLATFATLADAYTWLHRARFTPADGLPGQGPPERQAALHARLAQCQVPWPAMLTKPQKGASPEHPS